MEESKRLLRSLHSLAMTVGFLVIASLELKRKAWQSNEFRLFTKRLLRFAVLHSQVTNTSTQKLVVLAIEA